MSSTLNRWGLWGIPVAGVLTFLPWLGIFLGSNPDPATDQAGFARSVTSPLYTIAGDVYIIGLFCLLFGLLALYAVLADGTRAWAAAGMISGVVGVTSVVGVWTILVIGDAVVGDVYLSGHTGAGAAFQYMSGGHWNGRIVPLIVVGGLGGLIGGISLGITIWRSERSARWFGVAFGIGFLLSIVSAPIVSQVGALLLIVSGVLIARAEGHPAATAAARPVVGAGG